MEEDAGGVEHPGERRPAGGGGELALEVGGEAGERRLRRGALGRRVSLAVEPAAQLDAQVLAPVNSLQLPQRRIGEQAVDRRQAAAQVVGRGGGHGTAGHSRRSDLSVPPKGGPPPAAAPEGQAVSSAAIAALAARIEEFRVTAERFFNGALRVPPEDLRQRIARDLRELRSDAVRGAAEQFRLTGLEARFNSLSELFGRRLREREEGRGSGVQPVAAREPEARYDPQAGVVLGRGGTDPAAVEALFAGLARAGAAGKLDLESFRGYLERQIREIGQKTGAEQVQFRLASEEGRLKLKARPIRPGESGD